MKHVPMIQIFLIDPSQTKEFGLFDAVAELSARVEDTIQTLHNQNDNAERRLLYMEDPARRAIILKGMKARSVKWNQHVNHWEHETGEKRIFKIANALELDQAIQEWPLCERLTNLTQTIGVVLPVIRKDFIPQWITDLPFNF